MKIIIDEADLAKLKPATRQDLLTTLFASSAITSQSQNASGFDFDDVANLSPEQVAEFMEGCSPQTVAGLRVIADHGPVILGNLLNEAGIYNYGHFQGSVTKRTRTVTGDKHAFLFTWDDWSSSENGSRGYGHYAVTEATFRSLRKHFALD